MKKLTSIIVSLTFILCCVPTLVYADDSMASDYVDYDIVECDDNYAYVVFETDFGIVEEYYGDEIEPQDQSNNHCSSNLTISSRQATCKSEVYGSSSITKIVVAQTLEKKAGKIWAPVTDAIWSTTISGNSGTVTKTKSNLTTGTYRLKTTATFYTGSSSETVVSYSSEIII